MRRSLTLLAAVALLVACAGDGPPGNCACTLEFRFFTLTVVDTVGQPVDSVAIEVRSERTGDLIDVSDDLQGPFGAGTYVVFSDNQLSLLPDENEPVRVTGAKGAASFVADFVFAPDGPCRCHVTQVSGPDTVTIR